MNIETIKTNINRKIERYIKEDKLSFAEIIDKLAETRDNFQKILDTDNEYSKRKEMISKYIAFSEKRIKDIETMSINIMSNEFFSGISDLDVFNLIKLRDKISQEVIEGEFN